MLPEGSSKYRIDELADPILWLVKTNDIVSKNFWLKGIST